MPKKHYVVTLTAAERSSLQALIAKGKVAAQKRLHAQILLKANAGPAAGGWTDQQIVDAFDLGRCTVGRVRQRFVEDGLDEAPSPRPGAGVSAARGYLLAASRGGSRIALSPQFTAHRV